MIFIAVNLWASPNRVESNVLRKKLWGAIFEKLQIRPDGNMKEGLKTTSHYPRWADRPLKVFFSP
jgi:hypothetical protein